MSNQQQVNNPPELAMLERVLMQGDLSSLSSGERLLYYNKVCESLGVNPLTRPFDYLRLDGKLVLYAKRDCTDQLRTNRNVSITITSRERVGDIYVVGARATMPDGRADESTGAVWLFKNEKVYDSVKQKYVFTGNVVPLVGDELANAFMKAETKAKRRVTLSICGLGFLDESEIGSIEPERIEMLQEPVKQETPKQAGAEKPPVKSTANENKVNAAAAETPANDSATPASTTPESNEHYRIADYELGKSPSGIEYAKMTVVNVKSGGKEYLLVRREDLIKETSSLDNDSVFEIVFDSQNGWNVLQAIRIKGKAGGEAA